LIQCLEEEKKKEDSFGLTPVLIAPADSPNIVICFGSPPKL